MPGAARRKSNRAPNWAASSARDGSGGSATDAATAGDGITGAGSPGATNEALAVAGSGWGATTGRRDGGGALVDGPPVCAFGSSVSVVCGTRVGTAGVGVSAGGGRRGGGAGGGGGGGGRGGRGGGAAGGRAGPRAGGRCGGGG